MAKLINKFLSASGYKMRCNLKCGDVVPFYSQCVCSNCYTAKKQQPSNPNIGEHIPESQSAEVGKQDVIPDGTYHEEQNVGFSDDVEHNLLMISEGYDDHTRDDSFQPSASFGDFFSRPIRIMTYEWAVEDATPDYFGFNPWELYLNTPSVLEKLSRFRLLKATLNLKFVINGSPFHYGRFFVGCRPSAFDNNRTSLSPVTVTAINNQLTAGFTPKSWYGGRVLYSQRKHVFLDPSTNQTAQIVWPFIAAQNYIDLQEPIFTDRMGRIEMWELNQLRHANGGTDPVRISCFAYLSDVQITGLTYNSATPVAQSSRVKMKTARNAVTVSKKVTKNHKNDRKQQHSSKGTNKHPDVSLTAEETDANEAPPPKTKVKKTPKNDEYGGGVVTSVATAVTKGAHALVDVPYIGPFARATEIGAGAIGSIAKLFGFSRPPQIEDLCQTRGSAVGRMAVTAGGDPLRKLTIDPKQELCVDPATVGLGSEDEMSFLYIAKHESLITQFPWTLTGTGSTGTIFMTPVNPWSHPQVTILSQNIWCQTALSYITRPFTYWNGSLRYRIQIVASQFHRGRLLIQYEPYIDTDFVTQEATIGLDGDGMNARYSHVLDLSAERDVTFEVNWSQPEAWRPVFTPTQSIIMAVEGPYNFSSVLTPATNYGYNGVLRISVITTLTAPTDSPVEVNVYLSAGDSFQVAAPSDYISGLAYARVGVPDGPPTLPPIPEAQSNFVTGGENEPMAPTDYVLNGDYKEPDVDANSVFFGEQVQSIRTMLKRYNFHRSVYLFDQTDEAGYGVYWFQYSQQNFPRGPGIYLSNPGSALTLANIPPAGAIPYNICNMTYLEYYSRAFVGYRGGVRWKVVLNRTERVQPMKLMVGRRTWSTTFTESRGNSLIVEVNNGAPASVYAQNALQEILIDRRSMTGVDLNLTSVNSSLEYEVPFYSQYRYADVSEPERQITNIDLDGSPFRVKTSNGHSVGCLHKPIAMDSRSGAGILNTTLWSWDLAFDNYCAGAEDMSFFIFIGAPPIMLSDATSVTPA